MVALDRFFIIKTGTHLSADENTIMIDSLERSSKTSKNSRLKVYRDSSVSPERKRSYTKMPKDSITVGMICKVRRSMSL